MAVNTQQPFPTVYLSTGQEKNRDHEGPRLELKEHATLRQVANRSRIFKPSYGMLPFVQIVDAYIGVDQMLNFQTMGRKAVDADYEASCQLLDRVWMQVASDKPLDVDEIDNVVKRLTIVRRLMRDKYSERADVILEECEELSRQLQ